MSAITLTDRLLREALAPAPTSTLTGELAAVVSERTRSTRQVGRRWSLPWVTPASATLAEAQRIRAIRLVLLAAVLAVSTAVAVVGAQLVLLHPPAPPQVLLGQSGSLYSVLLDGSGQRRPVTALGGRSLRDFSVSMDGSRLATLRSPDSVLEIWDAADVLDGRATAPIAVPQTEGLVVLDAGVWRPDGASLLISASAHGLHGVYDLDVATGATTQVSPARVYVDDWQQSFDGRWIEIAGQFEGRNALFVVDLSDLSHRVLVESDGGRVPQGGALGWSPDSRTMTFHLQDGVEDLGIWSIGLMGNTPRRVTPPGQAAAWMNWSPDGQWIGYETVAAQPTCTGGTNRRAAWVVRPDGTDAHLLADGALPLYWAVDSRSMIVESLAPQPGAPLGGVVHAFLDGSPSQVIYPYAATDATGLGCHPYELITKFYRGMARGIR